MFYIQKIKWNVIGFALLGAFCTTTAYAIEADVTSLSPLPSVQEKLLETVKAARLAKRSRPDSMERYENRIEELEECVDGNKIVLTQQWLYFLNEYVLAQEGQRRSDLTMVTEYLLESLGIQDKDIAFALYPYLGSSDEDLRQLTIEYLQWSDMDENKNIDFTPFEEVLKQELRSAKDLPSALVKYMYWRAPGVALITIMNADPATFGELKSALEISDANEQWPLSTFRRLLLDKDCDKQRIINELRELSQRPEWWIKHFVAELVTQIRELDDDLIRTTLSESENPLVRGVLANPDKYSVNRYSVGTL